MSGRNVSAGVLFLSPAVFLCLFLSASAQEQTESITLTTYYPSPYGVYQQMQTGTLGVGDTNGDGWVNSQDVPSKETNKGDAWIAGDVGIGTRDPRAELHVNGTVIADKVGIGTNNPQEALDINGDVNVSGTISAGNIGSDNWPTLDYSTCVVRMVGKDCGPHTRYCPRGYIMVGGTTDGNDFIWEDIICCKLEGVNIKNWSTKPTWWDLPPWDD